MKSLTIVTKPARTISDGFAISQDAYIVIDKRVPSMLAQQLAALVARGLVRAETARLKPHD